MPGAVLERGRRRALPLVLCTLVVLFALAGRAYAAAGPPNWAQLTPGQTPIILDDTANAYDPATHQFVVFGGETPSTLYASGTWIWDGSNWSQPALSTSPPQSEGGRMAYDAASGQLILFGGDSFQGGLNGTWQWTGSSWVQLHPATSPPPSAFGAMAYDAASKQIILFGGNTLNSAGAGPAVNTMWAWNGSTWTQLTPATLPSARNYVPMAWDPATSQLILYGGGYGGYYDDTWIWNGTTWTQANPSTNPGFLGGASLVYDPATKQMLLIGGSSTTGSTTGTTTTFVNTVWAWTGSNWVRQSPANPLTPARELAAADFDAQTNELVLFGGLSSNGQLNDTWVWTPLKVNTQTLPPPAVGLRYRTMVQAVAGTTPYTFSVISGKLPTGLSLAPSGLLSGVAQSTGTFKFTISVQDGAGHTATRAFTVTVNPTPKAAVWVSNGANSTINAFPLNSTGNVPPSATLSSPALDGPGGLVLDASGELYVSNSTPSVTVFAPGATGTATPIRTIEGSQTGLGDPAGLTLDPAGRLYVANGAGGDVLVYNAGAGGDVAPYETIGGTNTTLRQPMAVTIDSSGDVWVVDYANNTLDEFPPPNGTNGDVAPMHVIGGLDGPFGLTQDSAGDLIVSNFYGQSVTEYAPSGLTPKFTITGNGSDLDLPQQLDVDAADNLYVANEFGGVNEYAPGASTPMFVNTSSTLASPHSLAVAPPMSIATTSLPAAGLGRRYSVRLFAALAPRRLRWRVTRGHLPAGLRLSRSGRISGVPRRAGRSSFTVEAIGPTKQYPSQKRRLTLVIRPAPTVSSVTPGRGRLRGGTLVTIRGSGFALGNSTIIDFGRYSAVKVRCRSHTVCTAHAPVHPRGAVAVTVTVDGLTSAPSPKARFSYRRR